MNEHFIRNIEIKNFKCFEDFKAEGFGRVNLIGGKNNVGKTAFMEACYINAYSQDIKGFIFSLSTIKYMRENLNILSDSSNHDDKSFIEQSDKILVNTNKNNIHFKIDEKDGIKKYHFEFNKTKLIVNVNDFSFSMSEDENIQFIDNFGLSNSEIINNYSAIQKRDEEDYLNNLLHQFDSNINAFKIIGDSPQCRIDKEYLEITEFGDGIRHLVSIVTSLYMAENGYLFIDELDNGIHYTMLDELWKVILEVSAKLNVQIFATTHSKECIESYAKVAKKLEEKDEDITYTYLTRLKDNSLYASIYTKDILETAIQQEHEVR